MRDLSQFKGCPAPQPVTLQGRTVTVEPFDGAVHLHDLWDALGGMGANERLRYFAAPDFGGVDDFSAWLEGVQQGKASWVPHVFRDNFTGRIVGMANYMRADLANGVVEVGGVAHGEAMARSPLSTEAHYLMAKHVFEDLGYLRYEWKCHSQNQASRAAATRYGFAFEGIFRQHMISRGKLRDTAWFSMIDLDWPLLDAAFKAWLAPENFDADGKQKRRLEDIRRELGKEQTA